MTNDTERPSESDVRDDVAHVVLFLRRAARFWTIVLAGLVIGAMASAAFYFLRKPMYRSETVILYSQGIRDTTEGQDQRDAPRTVALRLKEILTSRAELSKIVSEFHLYPNIVREQGPVEAVDELRRHVQFKAPGGDTFSISFEGTSPEQAKNVTERLSKAVIDQDGSLRKKQAIVTRDFLELEKMGTGSHLRDAEEALAKFMAAHPRFALDATPLATGAAIRATMGSATQGQSADKLPFMPLTRRQSPASSGRSAARASSPESRAAAEEQAKAEAALDAAESRLAELSTRFTPEYPDVKNAQAEVDRAKARLAAAAVAASAAAVGAPDTPRAASRAESAPGARSLRAALAPHGLPPRSPEDEKHLVTLETEWVKLTRAVTEARQHEDQVEAALFKANISANSEAGGHGVQVSVIDPPFLPERPVPPGRGLIMALILAASLALGVVGSLVAAVLDDRIFDRRELVTLAPVLVTVPRQLGRADG